MAKKPTKAKAKKIPNSKCSVVYSANKPIVLQMVILDPPERIKKRPKAKYD